MMNFRFYVPPASISLPSQTPPDMPSPSTDSRLYLPLYEGTSSPLFAVPFFVQLGIGSQSFSSFIFENQKLVVIIPLTILAPPNPPFKCFLFSFPLKPFKSLDWLGVFSPANVRPNPTMILDFLSLAPPLSPSLNYSPLLFPRCIFSPPVPSSASVFFRQRFG